jgi:hypothetical protein
VQAPVRVISIREIIHSNNLDFLHGVSLLLAVNNLAPVMDGVAVAAMSSLDLTLRCDALNLGHRQSCALATAPHVREQLRVVVSVGRAMGRRNFW